MPTRVLPIEIEAPLPEWVEGAERYDRVWVVAMARGVPIGRVLIDNAGHAVSVEHLRSELVRQLGEWPGHAPEEAPGVTHGLGLSIVVCTRDRPEDLATCLRNLSGLDKGGHRVEIVVVDNHPASGLTAAVVAGFPAVRYETETRPGVACARNRGVLAARGEIVAFIDDDVVVPPGWPARLLAPFADPRVACVTGLVLPLELETESQELYEEYGGLGRGYDPRVFDSQFFHRSRRHVVHTWELGGTANAAIRKSVLPETGLFDETLGPGLPTGVGEDIYMFYRLLELGHVCRYEPAAYVWHRHRRDRDALRRQLYQYSKGQTSYQLRTLVSNGDRRVLWQLFVNLPLWHLAKILRILRGKKPYPLRLVAWEILGNLVGPVAFVRTVRMHRRLNGPRRNPIAPPMPSAGGIPRE